ncbi:MAG: hypothetical protein ABL894_07210 [Hyphomicrobium sp.]
MIRKTFLAALAVSALGSVALTATAEAGGIRLGFGGPMASFIAVPTHGGSGGSSARSSYGGSHCAKKKPSVQYASRPHSEPRRAEVTRSEPKPAREKVKVASVQRETNKPAVTAKTEDTVKNAGTDVKTETTAVTANSGDNSSGLTGSKALAQTDNAASTAAATTEANSAETVAVAEKSAEPMEAQGGSAVQAEVSSDVPAKDVGCKKFIPSVGVTIDVGCKK